MNEAEMSSSLSIFFFGWIFRLTGRCWTIKKWKRIWKKKKEEEWRRRDPRFQENQQQKTYFFFVGLLNRVVTRIWFDSSFQFQKKIKKIKARPRMNEVVKKRFHLCFHTLPSFTEFSLLSRISSVNWTGFRYSNYLITYTVVPYLVSIVYLVLPSFTISTFNHFIRFISSNLFYGIYKGTTSCFNSLPSFTEFRHFFRVSSSFYLRQLN